MEELIFSLVIVIYVKLNKSILVTISKNRFISSNEGGVGISLAKYFFCRTINTINRLIESRYHSICFFINCLKIIVLIKIPTVIVIPVYLILIRNIPDIWICSVIIRIFLIRLVIQVIWFGFKILAVRL